MVGKRTEAEQISKWLGSLGEIGTPPEYWFVNEAAKELGMSYADLATHPDKFELMRIAFTVSKGRNEGEYLKEINPRYQRMVKDAQGKIAKAQKRK